MHCCCCCLVDALFVLTVCSSVLRFPFFIAGSHYDTFLLEKVLKSCEYTIQINLEMLFFNPNALSSSPDEESNDIYSIDFIFGSGTSDVSRC